MTNRLESIIRAAQCLASDDWREVEFNDDAGPVNYSTIDWADVGAQCWDRVYLDDLLKYAKIESITSSELTIARAEYIAEFEVCGRGSDDDYAEHYEYAHG